MPFGWPGALDTHTTARHALTLHVESYGNRVPTTVHQPVWSKAAQANNAVQEAMVAVRRWQRREMDKEGQPQDKQASSAVGIIGGPVVVTIDQALPYLLVSSLHIGQSVSVIWKQLPGMSVVMWKGRVFLWQPIRNEAISLSGDAIWVVVVVVQCFHRQ